MKMDKRIVAATAAAITLTALMPATTSQAVTNKEWGSGGKVVARLHESKNFKGAILTVYGTSQCSSSTSDNEIIQPRLSNQEWNDVISSVRDYESCDVNLYEHRDYNTNDPGASTGFVHYGSTGANLGALNDKASSFKIS
ncbi:hypothetical protein [Tessaracoccus caeni]|uniref:hypothetical protein n=1 Tax=Tessaracoccus caeni TaxID=3031239 RepID=UPI0023DCA126|nr:hypothetical protein [Tessaracoccus caeni]MDF1487796.1 hypothetical protein [Tessaracoccus caeni]